MGDPSCQCYCGPGSYCCNSSSGQCCPLDVPNPDPLNPPGPGPGPDPPAGCTVTAPSNLTATRISSTNAVLNWTPGINGGYQALWVSTDPDPQTGCAGSAGGTSVCPVRLDSRTPLFPSDTGQYIILT